MVKRPVTQTRAPRIQGLILQKLEKAQKEYDSLRGLINNADGNDTADIADIQNPRRGASTLSINENADASHRRLSLRAGHKRDTVC